MHTIFRPEQDEGETPVRFKSVLLRFWQFCARRSACARTTASLAPTLLRGDDRKLAAIQRIHTVSKSPENLQQNNGALKLGSKRGSPQYLRYFEIPAGAADRIDAPPEEADRSAHASATRKLRSYRYDDR